LNFDKELPTAVYTEPIFKGIKTDSESTEKKISKELSGLMHISDKLADLNWKRNQDWTTPFSPENARLQFIL
jgi:cytoplasmic iron level regulating protein YaaA (DUF328/UPF0246 family)